MRRLVGAVAISSIVTAVILSYMAPTPSEADGWSSRTPLVGNYFAAAVGSTADGSVTTDTLVVRFPRHSSVTDGHVVASGDSSTSVTYAFFNREGGGMQGELAVEVYSRSCIGGKQKFVVNSVALEGTLPGFSRGIDSLYCISESSLTLTWVWWGMK